MKSIKQVIFDMTLAEEWSHLIDGDSIIDVAKQRLRVGENGRLLSLRAGFGGFVFGLVDVENVVSFFIDDVNRENIVSFRGRISLCDIAIKKYTDDNDLCDCLEVGSVCLCDMSGHPVIGLEIKQLEIREINELCKDGLYRTEVVDGKVGNVIEVVKEVDLGGIERIQHDYLVDESCTVVPGLCENTCMEDPIMMGLCDAIKRIEEELAEIKRKVARIEEIVSGVEKPVETVKGGRENG